MNSKHWTHVTYTKHHDNVHSTAQHRTTATTTTTILIVTNETDQRKASARDSEQARGLQ